MFVEKSTLSLAAVIFCIKSCEMNKFSPLIYILKFVFLFVPRLCRRRSAAKTEIRINPQWVLSLPEDEGFHCSQHTVAESRDGTRGEPPSPSPSSLSRKTSYLFLVAKPLPRVRAHAGATCSPPPPSPPIDALSSPLLIFAPAPPTPRYVDDPRHHNASRYKHAGRSGRQDRNNK